MSGLARTRRHNTHTHSKPRNHPPPHSFLVDRLVRIDEQDYVFAANTWIYLSWLDPRAPAAVKEASAAAAAPGGQCRRLCNSQSAETDASRCCDSMWLPSLVIRNIFGAWAFACV